MPSINMENRNKYALITGGTSGIGYELARLFAADGYNLILVARNERLLQEVSDELKQEFSVEITPLAGDLFDRNAPERIYHRVQEMGVEIDALVNNAGQGEWGPFAETDLQRDLDIVQLNIAAPLALTKYFLHEMLARNEGKILNLGSEAGTTPVPLLAVYAATKAFMISFSVALADELRDTDITITVLLPGATDTDFFHKAGQEDAVIYREKNLLSPQQVAKDGYEALMKGERKIISGAKTKMHVMMADLLGAQASAAFMRKQMQPSEKAPEAGRTESRHEASQRERDEIENTGGEGGSGDYPKEKGLSPEAREGVRK
jgi:short-subunit dehydrogenase